MDFITAKLAFIQTAIKMAAGSYGTVMLMVIALSLMTKNRQKIDEAKEGMKYVAIGLLIILGAPAIISFIYGK